LAVGAVPAALIPVRRIALSGVTNVGWIARCSLIVGGLVAVPRVWLPRRPGALARALRPGVAPGAVMPSRFARRCRRTPVPVAVVLAVRRGTHRLGHRGRVAVGGRRERGRGRAATRTRVVPVR